MNRKKRILTAVALLGIRDKCDRLAQALETAGDIQRSQAADRMSARIQRALDESQEDLEALDRTSLIDVLRTLKDLNSEEEEILSEALGEDVESFEDDFNYMLSEEDSEETQDLEEVEDEEAEKKEARRATVQATPKHAPARRAFRVRCVR